MKLTNKMLFRRRGENISSHSRPTTAAEYLRSSDQGSTIHETVSTLIAALGPVEVRESKRGITFRRRHGFAFLWCPGQYLHSQMPAVLSIALPRKVPSPRFRLVAHPLASVWMHHLELPDASSLDAEVASWLRESYDAAEWDGRSGSPPPAISSEPSLGDEAGPSPMCKENAVGRQYWPLAALNSLIISIRRLLLALQPCPRDPAACPQPKKRYEISGPRDLLP